MTLALDTSAAVALLMASHMAHRTVRDRLRDHDLVLTQQSLAETYSVLTRLPGDARVRPDDAVQLIAANFGPPVLLPADLAGRIPERLAELGVSGGAVYDALVGLAAGEASLPLATRDLRAAATYRVVGVDVVELVDQVP
jgi:predicted nucleic acid-binding protein